MRTRRIEAFSPEPKRSKRLALAATGRKRKSRILIFSPRSFTAIGISASIGAISGFAVERWEVKKPELLACLTQTQPDVLIVDMDWPHPEFRLLREILGVANGVLIIVLLRAEHWDAVPRLIKAGIRGYLLGSCSADQLRAAVEQVKTGAIYFSPPVQQLLTSSILSNAQAPADPEIGRLSPVERKIARLVASDFRNKEIADRLSLSQRTVEVYRAAIMRKLKVRSSAGIVRFAIRTGLSALED